jgi:hypothetical protein
MWRSVTDQLFPGWTYHPAADQKGYFDDYRQAVSELNNPGAAQNGYARTLLAVSERIYDGEVSRRESLNARCAALLSTGGILGALVVAAGQLGLAQKKGSYGTAALIVLALFIVSLLYIGASIVMALAVQGSRQGSIVDPTDLPPNGENELNTDPYSLRLSKVHLTYTIQNYVSNNSLKFKLVSGQRCLRNGIIAIIIAGILSPLALHSEGSNPVRSQSPNTKTSLHAGTRSCCSAVGIHPASSGPAR